MLFWLHQYQWSSRFTIFFQFLTHKPLLFFLFQVVDVQVVVVPALAALKPSYLQANFTGAFRHRGKARGVTTLFTTHLNCNGGQEIELYSSENGNSFGFWVCGGPDWCTQVLTWIQLLTNKELFVRNWSAIETCRPHCMGRRTSGTICSRSWKKIHQAVAWHKHMKHGIGVPVKHSQTSSQLQKKDPWEFLLHIAAHVKHSFKALATSKPVHSALKNTTITTGRKN